MLAISRISAAPMPSVVIAGVRSSPRHREDPADAFVLERSDQKIRTFTGQRSADALQATDPQTRSRDGGDGGAVDAIRRRSERISPLRVLSSSPADRDRDERMSGGVKRTIATMFSKPACLTTPSDICTSSGAAGAAEPPADCPPSE